MTTCSPSSARSRAAANLLPVEYHHVVFTLPAEVHPVGLLNPAVYDALLSAAADAVRAVAADPKHLGAEVGLLLVLHTWGQPAQPSLISRVFRGQAEGLIFLVIEDVTEQRDPERTRHDAEVHPASARIAIPPISSGHLDICFQRDAACLLRSPRPRSDSMGKRLGQK